MSESRFRDHYDLIVLGTHPGALLSGAFASRHGHSVLIVPQMPAASVVISASGQCLDPETGFLMGLQSPHGHPGILTKCFEALGVSPDEVVGAHSGGFQILTPASRSEICLSPAVMHADLKREFGSQVGDEAEFDALVKFTDELLSSSWSTLPTTISHSPGSKVNASRELKNILARFKKSLAQSKKKSLLPRDGEWSQGLGFGVTSGLDRDLPFHELLHLVYLSRSGGQVAGGLSALRRRLTELAVRLGAQVAQDADCRRIFVEKNRFAGIQLTDSGSMISAEGGILGCALDHARERITSGSDRWRKAMKPSPRPQGWKFTLALTVRAEGVPAGATRRMIWSEEGAPPVEIEIADTEAYGVLEPEHRLVFLRSVLPFSHESLQVSHQRVFAARLFQLARTLLPFLEYHVVRMYPDYRVEEDEFSQVYGFAAPELIPDNLRCFGTGGGSTDSGLERLWVVSEETYARFGHLGSVVGALEATAALSGRISRPGPMP